MSRPHEDRQRHTDTDHRAGGPAIVGPQASWWAIDVIRVTAERAPAAIASYETLIEKARTSTANVREAAVLRSHDRRRVIALLQLAGHEAFRHLSAAWDDRHLFAERHAVAESRALALYRLDLNIGEAAIDPASTDAYAFEHLPVAVERMRAVTGTVASAPGFRGATVFGADDDRACAFLYRFALVAEIEAFRANDTLYPVHVARTFGQ